jgi:murein DD-endopeptidase MepM/ murein hydrolase activator NlpD
MLLLSNKVGVKSLESDRITERVRPMRKLVSIFASTLVVVIISLPTWAQTQAPTAQQVLEKALAALGGKERLEKIRTRAASGKVEAKGVSGTYQLWAKAPDRLKMKLDIAIQHLERGYDGTSGWEKRAGVRELGKAELEKLKQRAVFNPLLNYLNAGTPVELKGKKQLVGAEAYEIQFTPKGETPVTFFFDTSSFLLLREDHQFADATLKISYSDYRKVNDVMIPFTVKEESPGQTLSITFDEYKLDAPLDESLFKNPLGGHQNEPYEVSLATIPFHVYKENDGVDSVGATESFVFNLLVKEKFGRALEPKVATIEFYSGANRVKTVELETAALMAARKVSYQSLAAQDEVFDLQQYFSEPVALHVDKLIYNLELTTRQNETVRKSLEIPVTDYIQKTKLIFPLKGVFVVAGGHDFNEEHKGEWSQQYAYDILALGPHYEIVKTNGETNEDFYAWGREIIAPADGTVVYARNDIQDNPRPDVIQTNVFLKMPEPVWAVAGNVVVIDHGNGEFSLLAHMQKGSVRVKAGDKVKRGQVLGLLGNSGNSDAPHLHYQLMAGGVLYHNDGLPSRFENLENPTPKRGVFLEAK